MYLRELDGLYEGKIREFPSEVGLALVAAGRAVNPYADPAPVLPVPAAAAPQVAKKGARK